MKKRWWTANKGSVTIFIMLIMPLFILLSAIIMDRANYYFEYQHFVRENYLAVQAHLRKYDNDLFDRFGILAINEQSKGFTSKRPLSEKDTLKSSILELMQYRMINDLSIALFETIFESNQIQEIQAVFDKIQETIQLKDAINEELRTGKPVDMNMIKELIELMIEYSLFFDYPYHSLDEIANLDFTAGDLIQLEINSEIRSMQIEYFNYFKMPKENMVIDKIALSYYCIDYLGYSSNDNKRETYTSEYVLTGKTLKNKQKWIVESELGAIRVVINTMSILLDEKKMENYLINSGGDVRLQFLYVIFDAIKMSIIDVDKLMTGKSVPVMKLACYYADYIKLLLLVLPEDIELERIGRCIEEELGIDLSDSYVEVEKEGDFYYDYRFTEKYYHEARSFQGGYISNQGEFIY